VTAEATGERNARLYPVPQGVGGEVAGEAAEFL